jgi:hypothetical protein
MASQNAINTASPLSAKVYIEADITATKTAVNLGSIIIQSDAETADKTKPGFGVKGHVLNAATRYPIKGYTVRALFVEPATQQGTESTTLLGSAVSALDGNYILTWLDTPPVIQRPFSQTTLNQSLCSKCSARLWSFSSSVHLTRLQSQNST